MQVHVATAGPDDAPLVLLLHGFPGFWWAWRHQLPGLAAAGYRVAAADLRGYGDSDRPPRGYDLWTLAGDAAGLVRSLGAREATVVGAGWGGAVAWTLAALRPGVVARLAVLAAPHPLALRAAVRRRPWSRASRILAAAQLPRLPERRVRRDDAAWVVEFLRRGAGTGWAAAPEFAEVADRHRAAMLAPRVSHTAIEGFRWSVRSQFRPDGARYAAAVDKPVTVPVLQVHGADDPWIPERVARASARWCGAGHVHRTLPGVGHFPHQEAPQHVTDALLDFLDA
ncbi:alpha/beta fold hydrolase [Actinomycetospora cinnamomea]|uniref:Pimeloyl-ACP methyl ester carboxylesterase n=1 Tax=Actinomycetospora cinnamomea TaxID=663609 RepID=A0A2U1FB31_9PSEU|nr:alpha/beta hydrolase [Actinomycetospora cinnamomea]PVZ09395.1 pimeloyl-ACP methyl ester carboxylesterase [Actinomycetospora cinnamomea]